MKKLAKRSENSFNTIEAFKKKNCKCKACSCKCAKWYTSLAKKNSTKNNNSYFTLTRPF